jgi:hypothetical protein
MRAHCPPHAAPPWPAKQQVSDAWAIATSAYAAQGKVDHWPTNLADKLDAPIDVKQCL